MAICKECGMPVEAGEYHPYAACLMFKACQSSDVVKANLDAVVSNGMVAEREAMRDVMRPLLTTRMGAEQIREGIQTALQMRSNDGVTGGSAKE